MSQRMTLNENNVHPEALKTISNFHADVVNEVAKAVSSKKVVVVGMAQNPFVKKARKALTAAGMPFEYLEYGNYFSKWKARLAIKLWSGWPTYPQVFIDGKLLGGFRDLEAYLAQKK